MYNMGGAFRNKAFTLVELLAVIVILAIISLIATPIVLNIINDSKEQSTMRSAELYEKAVQNAIMKKQLDGKTKIKDGDYVVVDSNGDICYGTNPDVECTDDNKIEIDVEGEIPEVGSILHIGKDYTIETSNLTYKNKEVLNINGKHTITQIKQICEIDNTDTLGVPYDSEKGLQIGNALKCKVNDKETHRFYVLSKNENDSYNLIMERNICSNGKYATDDDPCLVPWVSKEDYDDDTNYGVNGNSNKGPITAMRELAKATKTWTNIPVLTFNYTDENINASTLQEGPHETGYNGIKITNGVGSIIAKDNSKTSIGTSKEPVRARLIKFSELSSTLNCTKASGNCKFWLANYMMKSNNFGGTPILAIYHNATLSSGSYQNNNSIFVVHNFSITSVSSFYIYYDNENVKSGLRPVITLPSSRIKNKLKDT